MAELSEAARAFLSERRFGVLATINPDGTPQQTVMWYALRGKQLMLNTSRGRLKDRNIRRDNRASVCVEDGYRFVTVSGTVELIEDDEIALHDIKQLAYRYNGPNADTAQFDGQPRVTWLLTIDHVLTNGLD